VRLGGPQIMTVSDNSEGDFGPPKAGPRCMGTTIRSSISSPSTSVNNPWLAYIWMYVGWPYTRSHTEIYESDK